MDISNKNVFVNKIKFGEDSTLRVALNSLEDYGTLSYDDIEGDENSKLNLKFTNGIKENGAVYKIFNSDNELILIENPLLDIIDMQDGSYSVSKKAAALLEEDLGLSNTEVNIVIALLNKPDDTTNKDFVNIQENLLNLLQSDDKRVFLTAKKALNALEGVDRSIYQSQITNLFNQLHIISSQMASNNISFKVGHSGGDMDPRAKVYIKGIYDRTKSSMGEGFRARSKGAVLGVQSEVTDTLTLGVGYATSQTTAKEDLRRTEVDTNTGFISAHYQPNAWWISGLATFSRGEYEEEKQILSSVGKASYDVDSWGAQVMTGYDIKLEKAVITPEVGLRYLSVKQEGYTDTLGTTVSGTRSDYLTAIAGIKTAWDLGKIRPTVGINVGYDIISDDVTVLNTLANGASYTVNSEALDRLSVGISTGIEAKVSDRTNMKLEYNGSFRKEYVDHSGMIKLEMRF
ncbi:MAG: autotransporter outer membrane beta-barrel domain-containing protein [Alphaproteobacteria bacterium]|nr:autotransporter outer membrane beta-barrel domain-containing protein [Alphaproteobacteria bacterium]